MWVAPSIKHLIVGSSQLGLSYQASKGLLAGERPCPLCLIWTGQGIVNKEIIVPNLLYYSTFSYYFLLMWSRRGWQFEVVAHGSALVPVWPFKFTMGSQSMPVWPFSGRHKSLSGISDRKAARPTNNPAANHREEMLNGLDLKAL